MTCQSGAEVWLYGSRARGDADELSDTDVLVITDGAGALPVLRYPRLCLSRYTWDEVVGMWSYGSLFLYHIRLEGRRLQPDPTQAERLPQLLASLPRFGRARQDYDAFCKALNEGLASLRDGGWADFECSVLATVIRHAAILAAYCIGSPAFGRARPFILVGEVLGWPSDDVAQLIAATIAWQKGLDGPHQLPDARDSWLDTVAEFIKDLGRLIDDYEQGALRPAS